MKDINIQNAGTGNVINQINLSVSEQPSHKNLSDLDIVAKKELPAWLQCLFDVLAAIASCCTIWATAEMNGGLWEMFHFWVLSDTSSVEKGIRFFVIVIAIAFTIFLFKKSYENFLFIFFERNIENRFRDRENNKTYRLKMKKCPKCGRESKLCIHKLTDSSFEFSCSNCGNLVVATYDDIFRFSEDLLRKTKKTEPKKDK